VSGVGRSTRCPRRHRAGHGRSGAASSTQPEEPLCGTAPRSPPSPKGVFSFEKYKFSKQRSFSEQKNHLPSAQRSLAATRCFLPRRSGPGLQQQSLKAGRFLTRRKVKSGGLGSVGTADATPLLDVPTAPAGGAFILNLDQRSFARAGCKDAPTWLSPAGTEQLQTTPLVSPPLTKPSPPLPPQADARVVTNPHAAAAELPFQKPVSHNTAGRGVF